MRSFGFVLFSIFTLLITFCYAEDTTNGYVMTIYGSALKSAYGDCIHTAYYNSDVDGREECGDAKELASAPVVTEKPKIIIETVTLTDVGNVLFSFDSSVITPAGVATIKDFGKKLGGESDVTKVTIDGYTDAMGKEDYNVKLSLARADTVKTYLIQNQIPADIIMTHGYGSKDAKTTETCTAKYGTVDTDQINQLQAKLNSKKYKSHSKKITKEKKQLQAKLNKLVVIKNNLVTCMASDRRVVFTIEHNKKMQKTVIEKVGASGALPQSLVKPPIDDAN